MREGLATLNDAPITFYGNLLDQFGGPVAGAKIGISIRIYNGVRATVVRSTTVSDANGFFEVKGGKGESLGIMPSKQGYVLATTGTYFKYSHLYPDHFTPDPSNPTVIRMWKLQGAEPLVAIAQHYKLQYTGDPIAFDLLAGKIVPSGGDLRITVNRPDGIISQQHPQSWDIRLDAVDGGLIVSSAEESRVTYAAPESGYHPSDTFSGENGSDVTHQVLFIKGRGGRLYAKLNLWFRINNTPDGLMYVSFDGAANTAGSGNWEATAPQ